MSKNKKILIQLSIFILIFIVSLIIGILSIQEDSFFYPWHDEKSYNYLLNEPNFEQINIDNNGKLLNGWIKYESKEEKLPLVIFFAGNAQNSSNTCYSFLANDIFKYFEGYNFMIVDYPGYGLSSGTPSDKTMFESALKIYDYACTLDNIDTNNIVILGYSIGV